MCIFLAVLMVAIGVPGGSALAPAGAAQAAPAQAPGGGAQGPAGPPVPAQATAPVPVQATASSMLKPALADARDALMALNMDKWKKGSVREEAGANVQSLLRDLDNNMQPLVTAADAAPGQLSTAIPLLKHLDAFYDVLLRVEEASRVSAPGEQVDKMQQALLGVSRARIAFDDALQAQAASQEKQIVDLQTAVRTEQASAKEAERAAADKVAAAAAPCKPAAPARKKRRAAPAKKPAPNPTAPNQNTPQSGPQAQKPQ